MFISIDNLIIATIFVVFLAVFAVLSCLLNIEASNIFKLYQSRVDDLQEVSNHWKEIAKDYAKIIKKTKF